MAQRIFLLLVASLAIIGASISAPIRHDTAMPVVLQAIVWACASGSLVISLVAASWTILARNENGGRPNSSRAPDMFFLTAMFLGVVAFAIQLVTLLVRGIYAATEIVNVFPSNIALDLGFGPIGVWILGALIASCMVGGWIRHNRRLFTVLYWLCVTMATWLCLLEPVYRIGPSSAIERSMGLAWLTLALGGILFAFASVTRLIDFRRDRQLASDQLTEINSHRLPWPGMRASFSATAMFIVLLACYQLAVPIFPAGSTIQAMILLLLGGTALAAIGSILVITARWNTRLADVTMWLISLSIAMVPALFISSGSTLMADSYPMVFNALLIGFAMSTGLCACFVLFQQQETGDPESPAAPSMMLRHAKRFIFVNAMIALVMGGMMALWPKIPLIASPDFSIGRVTAGFGGNLFLLLVLLWCSRRLGRITYHVLTMLALASTIGFMVVRLLPYSPGFG